MTYDEKSAMNLTLVPVSQSCLTLQDPIDCSQPGSSAHGIAQARILEWGVPFPSPGDLLGPGIKPSCVSLHWQVDSLRLKPPGKPVTLPEDPLGYECFQDFPLSLAVRL